MEEEVGLVQNENSIRESIAEIRKIQKLAAFRKLGPADRLKFYMEYLDEHFRYDRTAVNKFYDHIVNSTDSDFRYSDYMNVSRLFLKKIGACQQFSVGLAMLCYGDPEIECYQLILEKGKRINNPLLGIEKYKHSANYVRIPSLGVEGVVDPVDFLAFSDITSMEEYKNKLLRVNSSIKFLGMAYYEPRLHLEAIYMIMQTFGSGIKFDFDNYLAGNTSFMESYDQKRLEKVRGYQLEEEGRFVENQSEGNKLKEVFSLLYRKRSK